MHETYNIDIGHDILSANAKIARQNRDLLDKHNIVCFNVMGAIGSGKTALIELAIERLRQKYRIGVLAGDVVARIDAARFERHNVPVIGVNTGKECHLDAHLVEHAIMQLPLAELDIVFIENVGNLICPADYALGEHKRVIIVSVSEGDDIVEKHPVIFSSGDLVIVNKIDIAEAVGASAEKMANDAILINPRLSVIQTSVKKLIGVDKWIEFIEKNKNP